MDKGEEKSKDFYKVLGLKKECSNEELRNAYKKLALRWHPDRCSASGNTNYVEEAKMKFQAIQEAYSVLSDANKRFLYDVGAYDSDDDENGMGDFVGEMAMMMSQTRPSENGQGSFEELQELFEEMFQCELSGFGSTCTNINSNSSILNNSSSSINTKSNNSSNSNGNNKRNCSDMSSVGNANLSSFEATHCFTLGSSREERGDSRRKSGAGRRRSGRKQKVSSSHDVSSRESQISA